MKKKTLGLEVILGAFLLTIFSSAWGYEVIKVKKGGLIKGQVKFVGKPSPAKPPKITKDQKFCGKVPDETTIVGPGKGIKNVVVAIVNVEKGKAFDKKVTALIDNNKCRFAPHVQAIAKGQRIKIRNSDPLLHNTHPYLVKKPRNKTIVNLALPIQGQVIDITRRLSRKMRKDREDIIRIKCDAHEWMLGWLHVYDHPYFAVTDKKGTFSITNVPPGKYKVRAWHEALGQVEKDISIPASGKVSVKFKFSKK
ncbi:MAG: carboxypeptidase regulatory-like domain-containing protein [Candidatus Binatia bacterium]